ncbi:MAG TPA: hypothetical protein VJQ61_10805 [Sinomonas sp.]|nr:hypothetical protein [Sinomonas sp.]
MATEASFGYCRPRSALIDFLPGRGGYFHDQRGSRTRPSRASMLTPMDISEAPQVLEGQTSIEDLLGKPAEGRAELFPLQGCLPGLEDVA